MDDYISASDAAIQIGMSPARFASLLMNKRDILPTEINNTALANNPFAIFASKALEKFYAGNPTAINLCYLKIHRLDWDTYVASLSTAAATPTAETEAVLAAAPVPATQEDISDPSEKEKRRVMVEWEGLGQRKGAPLADKTAAKLVVEKGHGRTHEEAYATVCSETIKSPKQSVSKRLRRVPELAKKYDLTIPTWINNQG